MGDFIRYYDDVDITVAVQTPNGLMVPIVKHADELGLLEISAQVKALAKKVRGASNTQENAYILPSSYERPSLTLTQAGALILSLE